MATKKESKIPAAALALYDKLISTVKGVEHRGDKVPHILHIRGRPAVLVSFKSDGTLNLRLPNGAIDPFLAKYKTKLCESYGIVQKEYVIVPDSLLKNTSAGTKRSISRKVTIMLRR